MAQRELSGREERAAAVREAFVLPLIFLTVALGGGFRQARDTGQLVFLVPSLMALVLALLLIGVLFRAGALVPDRLMHGARPPLANLSGLLVLVTLFAASAQVFNTATPEAGLLQFVFNVFFLLLLWNTIAARPDRRRLLHSLLVLFGGAFVLKYVVLAALYDPQGGLTKRVLMALLEGVTLGGLTYQSPAPVTGYVAFFTILLFLIGLILLPLPQPPGRAERALAPVAERDRERAAATPRDLVTDAQRDVRHIGDQPVHAPAEQAPHGRLLVDRPDLDE
jgi:hypothetical protein